MKVYGGRRIVDRMLLALRHPAAQNYWPRVGRLLEEQIGFAQDEALQQDAVFEAYRNVFHDIIDNNTWEKQ